MREKLKQGGYSEFEVNQWIDPHAKAGFEKWIRKDGKKQFSIHVYEYIYPEYIACQDRSNRLGYSAKTQLLTAGGMTFNVELHQDWETVEEMETFFNDIFVRMNCLPY